MVVVERVTTPLTPFQMGEALIAGHRRYFGELPNPNRLAVAWSQCALEHAEGKLLYNFNFGNVTATASYEGEVYIMHVPPPDPPVLRFRSFRAADDGAVDYWTMLAGHYRPALALFDEGQTYSACACLGRLGYFTDNPDKYGRGAAHWFDWYAANLASSFAGELAEGRGNSLLSQSQIDEVLRRVAASEQQLRPSDPPAGTRGPLDTNPDATDDPKTSEA